MPRVELRPGFVMFAIVLAALDQSGSVLPIVLAMAVHELAHLAAVRLCGGRVRSLTLRFADLRMETEALGYRQELLAALAGPLVNLACGAALGRRCAAFAAYSLLLGLYNLLPVWPLDGGRMVRCALLERLPPARAQQLGQRIGLLCCAALLLLGLGLNVARRAGLWPVGTAAYLTARVVLLRRREDAEV